MNPLFIFTVLGPVSCAAGILLGLSFRHLPMRGWAALSLLFLSALIWVFIQKDDSPDERTRLMLSFTFIATIAVIYSFRARKLAPDQIFSRAAFLGSLLIAAALLFMLFGTIWGAFILLR